MRLFLSQNLQSTEQFVICNVQLLSEYNIIAIIGGILLEYNNY